MNPQPTNDDWVWLARIRHTQGRKGEVFADILTDFPEKFSERKILWLLPSSTSGAGHQAGGPAGDGASRGGSTPAAAKPHIEASPREVELAAYWLHKGGIVLHFAGVDSISAAESLAGQIVAIPRAQRAALADDEVHISDLIGCSVFDVSGVNVSGSGAGHAQPVLVGQIEDVDRTAGPVPLLVLTGSRGEVLIPFAKSFLRKLDLEARRLEMSLPEGLLDLNA